MAEMRAQGGGGARGGDQQKQMEERAKQMEDMKNGILSQVLDQKVGFNFGLLFNIFPSFQFRLTAVGHIVTVSNSCVNL